MTVHFFEGPAGSGKTYSLVNELRHAVEERPLLEYQKVLGLTVMHGARQRLADRLTSIPGLQSKVDCLTFDSFAWNIVRRWRSLAMKVFGREAFVDSNPDYELTCHMAGLLLQYKAVQEWTAQTYPIVVVDEAQDCKKGRLEILKALAEQSLVIAAADDFQDLFDLGENEAVQWLRSAGRITCLDTIHRTNESELLEAARCLRARTGLKSGSKFQVRSAYRFNDAASAVATAIVWHKAKNLAILTPCRPEKSGFVKGVLNRLTGKQIKPKPLRNPVGPFRIEWEASTQEMEDRLFKCTGLPEDPTAYVRVDDLNECSGLFGYRELIRWMENQRRLTGKELFKVQDVKAQISSICNRIRAHRLPRQDRIRAMIIHQAKNREFEGVVVLWPYQVGSDEEMNRRLLYNAVTRAKKWCVVIVQDPDNTRVLQPPFI
jgi:hypothetical protein